MSAPRRPKLSTQARLLPGDTTSLHHAAAGLQREVARLRVARRGGRSGGAGPADAITTVSTAPDAATAPAVGPREQRRWEELDTAATLLARTLTDFGDELALARREFESAQRDVDRNAALARAGRARRRLQERCRQVVTLAGDAVPPAPVGPFGAYLPPRA